MLTMAVICLVFVLLVLYMGFSSPIYECIEQEFFFIFDLGHQMIHKFFSKKSPIGNSKGNRVYLGLNSHPNPLLLPPIKFFVLPFSILESPFREYLPQTRKLGSKKYLSQS